MKRYIKIILTLIVALIVIYFFIFFYSPSTVVDFYRGEDERTIFVEIKPLGITKEISGTNNYKSDDLRWSPDEKHLAFFENIRGSEEWSYDREWVLKVVDPRFFEVKPIFIGTYKTSEYMWLNNQAIRAYVNAGSGVRIYRDIDINIPAPFVASENMSPEFWVPEKTF